MSYTISEYEGNNLGGLHQILWIFADDVLNYTFYRNSLLYIVNLKPGRSWNYLYTTPETIRIDADEKITPAGVSYSYIVKALVPRDRSNVELLLHQLVERPLIIKALDHNGVTRIFGFPDNPMKKSSKLLKPKEYESYNGYEISFHGEFPYPAGYALTMQNVIPIGGDPGGGPAAL